MDYDYIIVGAGSAGCTLAYRLGEDPSLKILVLEAGGQDRSPIIKVPLTWGLILKHRLYDWGYFTDPEPGMNGRRIECARGKVVGGSTSINGMAYARGMREDYDKWEQQLGLKGWGYDDVLPYFKRSESWEGVPADLRGTTGPLNVTRIDYRDPLLDGFMQSVREMGFPLTDDYNGRYSEGFGSMQATIHRGRRWSAASAYLRPAIARGNVTVLTGTLVRRVLLHQGHAVGVEIDGNTHQNKVYARREVLLSGGVVNSPQLLMLSGIGEADALHKLGIDVKVDLPGVGKNLQDHIACDVRWKRAQPGPLHRTLRLDRLTVDLVQNFIFGGGQTSMIPAAAVGLVRSDPNLALPNLQLILAAAPMTAGPHLRPFIKPYVDAFALKGIFLTPESRGDISLASSDARTAPLIRQRFLSTEFDRKSVREMIRLMRNIGEHKALSPFRAEELAPGTSITSDLDIDKFIQCNAVTLHHPVGTCKMGADNDPTAVLNDELQVRGVNALRVIDGSAMPATVRGPTNAPIIMIAEKASDQILGKSLEADHSARTKTRENPSTIPSFNGSSLSN